MATAGVSGESKVFWTILSQKEEKAGDTALPVSPARVTSLIVT
jgi:hypothetical protein